MLLKGLIDDEVAIKGSIFFSGVYSVASERGTDWMICVLHLIVRAAA